MARNHLYGLLTVLMTFNTNGSLFADTVDGNVIPSMLSSTVKNNLAGNESLSQSPTDVPNLPLQTTTSVAQPDNHTKSHHTMITGDNNSPSHQTIASVTENPADRQNSTQTVTKDSAHKTNTTTTNNATDGVSDATTNAIPVVDNQTQSKPTSTPIKPDIDVDNTSNSNQNESYTGPDTTLPFVPSSYDTTWMDLFIHTHHFEGQYKFNGARYLFDFVVRHIHPSDSRTLVANFYDADGAILELNGTSVDGHEIILTLTRIYTPGVRFPLKLLLEVTGSFSIPGQPYFAGNFTKPINSSFSWIHMNKGLGTIETGETTGTRTAIVIVIPTSVAFLGICGTIAIVCWASKKGYLRRRHSSYRLFTDAQVSYESEAETIHI